MKKYFVIVLFIEAACSSLYSQGPVNEEKQSLYKYALEMFRESKYDLVIKYCTTIIGKYIGDADTYTLRAKAYRSLADYENAALDYSNAISQYQQQYGKRDPSLSFDKGMVLMCQKKFDEAFAEFNDARRIFRQSGGNENFIYLEEIGLASHYKDDNRYAAETFKSAIQQGSFSAYIDLVTSLFQSNSLYELKIYCDSLMKSETFGFMSDSMFHYYIPVLNDIAGNNISDSSLEKINSSIRNYRTSNKFCFQGFYYDLLYARAYIQSALSNDSAAYVDYRLIAKNNLMLKSVRDKAEELKRKLGLDATPPSIALINPPVDINNIGKKDAGKRKVEIFGQVTDSSGLNMITVTANDRVLPPVTSTESDGLFGIDVEFNPGRNKIVITATDKNENISEKTFFIDFVEKNVQTAQIPDSLFAELPDINASVNYFAILIAEKDYEDDGFRDLVSPLDDAIEIRDILTNQYGFNEENMRLLTNANRQSIIDTLIKFCKIMNSSDNLLIFYAGHGAEKRVNQEIVGGYIIPSDAKKNNRVTYISNEDLVEPVTTTQAKHVLFILDACFAGLMRGGTMDDAPQGIKNVYNSKSRRILTSGNQEEVPDQGLFIANVKNFLRNPGKMYFTASDLYNYIVNNNHTSNTPVYERIKNSSDAGIGQFIFRMR